MPEINQQHARHERNARKVPAAPTAGKRRNINACREASKIEWEERQWK
jgi:hypothetical protein